MLNSIIISPEPVKLRLLQRQAIDSQKVAVAYSYDRYPSAGELMRMIGTVDAHLVFLDMEDHAAATSLLDAVHGCLPDTSLIAILNNTYAAGASAPDTATALLTFPCDSADFEHVIHTVEHSRRSTYPHLHAFLPAKAGSGCSTVVLNTGSALATTLKHRVLLLEADLRSGSLSIALSAKLTGSIQQALAMETPDSSHWNSQVVTLGKLDLLLSDRSVPKDAPQPEDYDRLLHFATSRYDSVVADLPELVNPATAELVRRAETVFIVCTQEILSLKLAEHRVQELVSWGVSTERIKVLVNRWQRSELPREDVIKLLKRPIAAVFPNDYKTVRETILNGTAVPSATELGASFQQFAASLAGAPPRKESAKRWPMAKMLQFLVGSRTPQPAA